MTADQEPRNDSAATEPADVARNRSGSRPEEAMLSTRLGAIADRHAPVPDWSDLVHRAELPPTIPLQRVAAGAGGGRRPLGRPALAVAAALIVVIGAVGTFAATRGGDDEAIDSGPAGPEDTGAEVIDTGWYIPSPMPAGWEVTSIEASDMNLVGPATLTVWAAPDGSASLTYAAEPFDDNMPMDGPSIQLSGEITATVLDEYASGYPGAIVWEHDDLFHLVTGNGLDPDEVKHAARQMADDPGRTTSPVDGLQLIDHSERTSTERKATDVTIELRTPAGRQLLYQLSPADGFGRSALLTSIPVRRQVDGQALEVLHLTARPGLAAATTTYLGLWPGADVLLPLFGSSDAMDGTLVHPTEEEVATLVRSLRPATAGQWRTFLQEIGLEVDDRLLTADRLADLSPGGDDVDGARDGSPTPGEVEADDEEEPVTTTVPIVDLADLLPSWPDETRSRFSASISPFSWQVSPPESEIPSGPTAYLSAQLTNWTTEPHVVNECTLEGTIIALVAIDPLRQPPLPDISRCDPDRVALTVAPGAAVDWPNPLPYVDGAPTRDVVSSSRGTYLGGTLPPGVYRLVTRIPGRDRPQVENSFGPITITPNQCGGFTTELVERYIFTTVAEAQAQAASDGRVLRVVGIDGVDLVVEDDFRCDRVNVGLIDSRIVWVDIY